MANEPRIAFDVRNELGEGVIWHPGRRQLLWFDMFRRCAFLADPNKSSVTAFGFPEVVSAAFIMNDESVLVATSSGLLSLNLNTGKIALVHEIEANNPKTHPNDCRAAPGKSLWFSTKGYDLEGREGAIHHYRNGELTALFTGMNCPNAICFSPAGDRAYFSETFYHRIMTCPVDPETGLPERDPEVFVDLTSEGACPDGAVIDSEGCMWCALYGGGKAVRYWPDGSLDRSISFPAPQVTCPCLGGPDLKTLYVTSGFGWMSPTDAARYPLSGAVFAIEVGVPGLPERTVTEANLG